MTGRGLVRRYRCEHCGERVIVLPRARDRVPMELYERSYATAELPAGDRWALAKHRGVESIDGLLRPPPFCLISHPCANRPVRGPARAGAIMADPNLLAQPPLVRKRT